MEKAYKKNLKQTYSKVFSRNTADNISGFLCESPWHFFKSSLQHDTFVFDYDNTVTMVINGLETEGTWQQISDSKIIIQTPTQKYILTPQVELEESDNRKYQIWAFRIECNATDETFFLINDFLAKSWPENKIYKILSCPIPSQWSVISEQIEDERNGKNFREEQEKMQQETRSNAAKIVVERWRKGKMPQRLYTSKRFRVVGRSIATLIIAGAVVFFFPADRISWTLLILGAWHTFQAFAISSYDNLPGLYVITSITYSVSFWIALFMTDYCSMSYWFTIILCYVLCAPIIKLTNNYSKKFYSEVEIECNK